MMVKENRESGQPDHEFEEPKIEQSSAEAMPPFGENELVQVSFDEIEDEDDYLEAADLFSKKNFWILGVSMLVAALLFSATLLALLYPFMSKVSGQWQTTSLTEEMQLAVKGKQAVLTVGNLSLPTSMTISFEGELNGTRMNTYQLTGVKAYVSIMKKELATDELAAIRANTDLYTIEKETPAELRLAYTKAGLAFLLGDDANERYFSFVREGIWFGEAPLLYLNNSLLSEERILFKQIE